MNHDKKKGMWISQQRVGAGSVKLWVVPMITAAISCEVLLAVLIELTGFIDIYIPWVMMIAAVCVAVAYGFSIKLNKQKVFFPAVLSVLLVVTVLCRKPLLNGFCIFWNQAGDVWTAASGLATPELASSSGTFSCFVFSVFTGIAIAVLCCALTSMDRYVAAIFVPLIAFIGMVLFHGEVANSYIFACLMSSMCLLVCGGKEEKSFKCIASRWLPVIICSVLVLIVSVFSDLEQWSSRIGEDVHDKLHAVRYETEYTTLPEGDFSNYAENDSEGQPALAVSMEQPEEMYLRGFTAADFSEDAWIGLDGEILAENEELLYWMNTNGRNPQMQFDQAAALIENNNEATEKSFKKVTVQNLKACSEYMYVPYSLSSEEYLIAENIRQEGLSADGNRMYTYSVVPESSSKTNKILKTLKESNDKKVEEYRRAEHAYRDFVYKNYLNISEDTATQMMPYWDMISQSDGNKDKLSLVQAQSYARSFLEECFPEEGDAPQLDLPLESVKGSSYQYATIAVLTLRYYGIPARYAEGYIITEEMAKGMERNVSIQLDESCAGAWAEVYQDGIGWIPMNMTPGIEEENSGTDPDAENGEEPQQISPKGTMKLDDMDDMAEEPDPDGGYVVSIKKVISFTALAIVFMLLLLMAALAVRRHIVLKHRLTRWNDEEINDAVAWIFADTVHLLKKLGFDRNGGSMTALISPVKESLGVDYAEAFEEMIHINSRAVFSSRELLEEHRETAKAFHDDTLERLKAGVKWYRRLWMQWILCLY